MSVNTIDLKMTGLDSLFSNDEARAENRLPHIVEVPISEIDDFPNHPFQVRNDEDMQELVQSVKERGVITPIILRKKEDGRYEIVSGHRRRKACELAGLDTVKSEIKDMTRDEAIILMVESNLQRTTILPSEKAFAYKMRLDALRRQAGRPSKENGVPPGHQIQKGKSRELVAAESPDSNTQIQRFLRLTELESDLLKMVDEGKIAMRPAVELSYLPKEEQAALLEAMQEEEATPSHVQAIKMRKLSADGKLDADAIQSIMAEEKPNQKEKISLPYDKLRQYIPRSIPYERTGDYILKALDYYKRYRERRLERER